MERAKLLPAEGVHIFLCDDVLYREYALTDYSEKLDELKLETSNLIISIKL
ncbi:hypothetical protein [Methanosphaera cuniculi]|uniref:Uncharacterized protein n=1 Tax=Methanosphaera cuniculi TaxID=1077256 RepID=A0A2V2BJZ6_9EURY|nr:hypothetical protein [Methanosphaera cuniculi]PWL08076.1 hypothetical protein MSCUN_10070 [Methanosphaera cuniculi]